MAPSEQAVEPSLEQKDEVRKAFAQASDLQQLPDRPFLEQERSEREQDITLKRWYAISLLIGLGVQIIVIDGVLFMYSWKGVHWAVDPTLIYTWLSATVVEVIGVVFVVTRHLFPRRDQR